MSNDMSNEASPRVAIMLIGIPGIGKTTIGKMVVELLRTKGIQATYVDQDQFYGQRNASALYLSAIDDIIASGKIPVMGKSHHDLVVRRPVLNKLTEQKVSCIGVNLMPADFRSNTEKVVQILIKRISGRPQDSSALKSGDAPKVLRDIFVKQFIVPQKTEGFYKLVQLDYTVPAASNAGKIVSSLFG
jgi:hypothetical protein